MQQDAPAAPAAEPRAAAPLPWRSHGERRVACADRARLMGALSAGLMECGADFSDGLTIKSPHCAARIRPSADSSELIVEAAADDAEFARDLTDALAGLAEELRGLE